MLHAYYFSGTGNARAVAEWIVSVFGERQMPAESIDLAQIEGRKPTVRDDDSIVLVSPTHGFNYPPITLAFVARFPRAPKHNPVYLLNTRAGMRIYKWYLPGLSGVALWLAALLFVLKGYRVRAMRSVDLPSNWISLHPGYRPPSARKFFEHFEKTTRGFAARIADGGSDFRAVFDIVQDLAIAPIALGYYFVGRFVFAKSFVASRDCNRCMVCVKQCPVKAIRVIHDRPYWTAHCESCMRCMCHCPKRAIETAHGFVLITALTVSWLLSGLLLPQIVEFVPLLRTHWMNAVVRNIVGPVWMIAGLVISHRVLHSLMRFAWVERLVVWTSLTHLPFWSRYRAPRVGTQSAQAKDSTEEQ